jgi:hypothetical protein
VVRRGLHFFNWGREPLQFLKLNWQASPVQLRQITRRCWCGFQLCFWAGLLSQFWADISGDFLLKMSAQIVYNKHQHHITWKDSLPSKTLPFIRQCITSAVANQLTKHQSWPNSSEIEEGTWTSQNATTLDRWLTIHNWSINLSDSGEALLHDGAVSRSPPNRFLARWASLVECDN